MDENAGLLKRILTSFGRQEGLDDLLAMSEHHDGYKRENAVRRLGVLGNPVAIPYLLVRENDWVPQVRNAAREALQRLLKSENAHAFILSLPALHHLQRCGRADHDGLIASVNQFFLQPENVTHIRAAVRNDNPYIARIAVRFCMENSLTDKPTLVSECLSHRDVVVRSLASNLLRDLTGEVLESMLQKAIRDPFMPVRREAFQIYLRSFPETGRRIARQMLFDRHSSIREIAIAQLVKSGLDVERIFSDVLSSSGRSPLELRCAILGAATLRAQSLIPSIRRFSSHRLPSLRKASLQAMARLAEEEVRPYLLAGMTDESPSVAKESMSLLSKATRKPTLSELVGVLGDASVGHTLEVCLGSARTLNKWDRLIFILGLCKRLSDGRVTLERLDSELKRWDREFNRSSSQPTNEQRANIKELYQRYCQALSEARRRSLEFTIRGFGVPV